MKFERKRIKSDMPKKVVSALTFTIVFIVFIAVLGGIAFWAYFMINEEAPEDSSGISAASSARFTESDNCNILFILTDNQTSQSKRTVHGFLVFGIHPKTESILITSFPAETMVEEAIRETPLSAIYTSGGSAAVKTSLEKLTGSSLDNVVELTLGGVEKIIKYYSEGVVFNVPETLDYNGSPPIKINAGLQTLSSTNVSDLLRYPASSWSGGGEQKAEVFGGVMNSFVGKYFTEKRFGQADTDYAKIIDMVKSDISIAKFHELKPVLEFIVKSKNKRVSVLPLVGEMTGEGENKKYFLNESFFEEYKKEYGI